MVPISTEWEYRASNMNYNSIYSTNKSKENPNVRLWKEVQFIGPDGLLALGTRRVWADTGEPWDKSDYDREYDYLEKISGGILDLKLDDYSNRVKKNKREIKLFQQEVKRKSGEDRKNHFERLINLFDIKK